MLAAYSSLEVTYESDRDNAVPQVARSIVSTSFGKQIKQEELYQEIWRGAARICLQTEGMIGTSVLTFQPSTPVGKRFLGGMIITGAKIDGDGFYSTEDGSQSSCQWALSCITDYSVSRYWDASSFTWVVKGGIDQRCDIYLCRPPKDTKFFCGIVVKLVDDGPMLQAQFFTDQNIPHFTPPMEEMSFS